MKKSFGNIITDSVRTKYNVGLNVYKNIDDIVDKSLPMLIVGLTNAKKYIKDFNILKKHYADNVWWTFTKTERGSDYYTDVDEFYENAIKKIVDNVEYTLIDAIVDDDVDKRLKDLFSRSNLYVYIDNNNFVYVYDEKQNIVYGLSLTKYGYVKGCDVGLLRQHMVNGHQNVIIKNFERIPFVVKNILNGKIHKYLVLYSYFN